MTSTRCMSASVPPRVNSLWNKSISLTPLRPCVCWNLLSMLTAEAVRRGDGEGQQILLLEPGRNFFSVVGGCVPAGRAIGEPDIVYSDNRPLGRACHR